MENVINNGNLTDSRLIFAKDKLHFLKFNRYGIIIREPLE